MKKHKTVIVRGCKFKVLAKDAREFEKKESDLIRKELNANNSIE